MPNRAIAVTSDNLSLAWGAALSQVVAGRKQPSPLLVSVFGYKGALPEESTSIRKALNALLKEQGRPSCDETGSTIFPHRHWESAGRPARKELYDWYLKRRLPKLKALDRKNAYGTYFERMIASTGFKKRGREFNYTEVNQLEFVIQLWKKHLDAKRLPRQSALQLSIFDPAKDHTGQALRGFPCLQQVSFSCAQDTVTLNAFYPVQYMFERAYGNYLGLVHLGHFVAHELGLRLTRLNCFTAVPEVGEVSLRELQPLLSLIAAETPHD